MSGDGLSDRERYWLYGGKSEQDFWAGVRDGGVQTQLTWAAKDVLGEVGTGRFISSAAMPEEPWFWLGEWADSIVADLVHHGCIVRDSRTVTAVPEDEDEPVTVTMLTLTQAGRDLLALCEDESRQRRRKRGQR